MATAREWPARWASNARKIWRRKIWRRLESEKVGAEPSLSGPAAGKPTPATPNPPTPAPAPPQGLFPSFFPTHGHFPLRFSSDSTRSFLTRYLERVEPTRESVLCPAPAKPPAADVLRNWRKTNNYLNI